MRHVSEGEAPDTVGEAVVDLREKVDSLTTAITAINSTFAQHASETTITTRKLQVRNYKCCELEG